MRTSRGRGSIRCLHPFAALFWSRLATLPTVGERQMTASNAFERPARTPSLSLIRPLPPFAGCRAVSLPRRNLGRLASRACSTTRLARDSTHCCIPCSRCEAGNGRADESETRRTTRSCGHTLEWDRTMWKAGCPSAQPGVRPSPVTKNLEADASFQLGGANSREDGPNRYGPTSSGRSSRSRLTA